MAIVEIRNLTYRYPGSTKPSLYNINLSVDEGEFFLITGPSGCGKTTLCKCLNGLIPNSYGGDFDGEVIVDGLSTKNHPVYIIAQRVGLVFQDPENELFCTSVEKEIAFGLENLGLPREEIRKRIEETIAMMGISHLRDRAPYELSGGEQQKVAIAALLAMKPKILVLDEPTANLDPFSSKSVLDLLSRLKGEFGMTIILVEHRLEIVAKMADRCAILNNGSIALIGKPEEVLYSDEAEAIGIGIPKVVRLTKALGIKNRPLSSKSLANFIMVRK
ncbi:MAG: energy-coupling factor ABC transporter ATP-binding protein [Candidatus Methanomethyliaceae archaeon]|nr:energy-coupling factor ABC transporter ATP-binding protein [Candidatus Methanomethyliaceae archaeon]MDW7970690.1 ABC transporter ATP-binding protein [Nitrososphaerota archaeon]